MKAIYVSTAIGSEGIPACYCRQCEFHFRRAISPLDLCPICGQNVELTMRAWKAAERKRLQEAPGEADRQFNGLYCGALSGSRYEIRASPHTWEKRIIRNLETGAESVHTNLDVSHLINARLLERTGEPMQE